MHALILYVLKKNDSCSSKMKMLEHRYFFAKKIIFLKILKSGLAVPLFSVLSNAQSFLRLMRKKDDLLNVPMYT